ncbi:uncharacterized protein LOC141608563 isoform X2 [Silene latifolia]|uniref:uncharacterized protein LOC141608563 isoform X2 n=1 Tax=Silene latifolia TaxID=37657 RepID=UPI003D780559
MAFAPVGVSRIPLLKAASLDSNGSTWVSNGCSLAPTRADVTWLAITKSAARKPIVCSAVQESSTPTVSSETKEGKPETKPEVKSEQTTTPAKPKPAAKVALKALPEMMEEDVIPSLRSILESQQDITELELVYKDNQLQGSFLQNGKPYTFWAFFPDGNLTGPKGFSLSSYGSEVSTVEPFLVDEKKPTAKQVVFWVEKRLAAQGIIPVWKQ